jgi:hypothetical protein
VVALALRVMYGVGALWKQCMIVDASLIRAFILCLAILMFLSDEYELD